MVQRLNKKSFSATCHSLKTHRESRSVLRQEKASAHRALPHQDPHATLFITSAWKMSAWAQSATSLLWLSAPFVPSFSDQLDDNRLWALLARWHFSWQTCCPRLASHLRCLSRIWSSWFNDVLEGLSIHLWAFHPLRRWGGRRVHAKPLTSSHSTQKLYKVRSFYKTHLGAYQRLL